MPDARLELLIRKPGQGGGSFDIKKVPSSLVYAGYRPKRIAEDGYDARGEVSPVDGKRYHVISAKDTQKYLTLNEREYFLWGLMDGRRDIREIASACFFEYGTLDFSAIRTLLSRLREAGLVEFVPSSRLRVAMDRSMHPFWQRLKGWLSKIDYRIEDADGWVTRLYEGGGRLFVNKFAMLMYLLVSIAGLLALGRAGEIAMFPYRIFHEHPVLAVSVLVLSFYPIAAVHELFHALACKRYGRKVHAFGFTLWDGFYPSFYTDVSDIYLSPKDERLFVSLAGPLSTIAIAAACFIPVAMFPEAVWAEAFYQVGRLNMAVAFISLYPFQFLKMDGYYLLVDLLGLPGLRERSYAAVRSIPDYISRVKAFTRMEAILLGYFFLSVLSLVCVTAYFFV